MITPFVIELELVVFDRVPYRNYFTDADVHRRLEQLILQNAEEFEWNAYARLLLDVTFLNPDFVSDQTIGLLRRLAPRNDNLAYSTYLIRSSYFHDLDVAELESRGAL